MTREEELDWLYRLRSKIHVFMPREWIIPMSNALDMAIKNLEQITKIADIVEGTIDHFDRDDAMDTLYDIKDVLKDYERR